MSDEQLFDVVVYEKSTRKVFSVFGRGMSKDSGHYNAERRLQTAYERINDDFDAAIVDAGLYDTGSILPEKFAK